MWSIFAYPLYFFIAYTAVMLSFLTAHTFVPSAPPILGFIARSMSAYLALLACALYGTIASLILSLFNLQHAYGQWTTARSFKWIGGAMTGVQFEVLDNGRELLDARGPMVLIGNHQTELDILMLGTIWPKKCSVTAKKSIKKVPFLGWFMSLSGAVFIDRVDRSQAMKAFDGAAKAMRELQQSVYIFPEGTRSYSSGPELLPFKKGAFHLAVQAQVDILPVVVENYSKVLNIKAKRFNSGTVRVKVLPPISTKGLTSADVDHLVTSTREKMLKTLNELSRDVNSRSTDPAESKKTS